MQSMAIRENTIRMNISQLEDKKAEIAESSTDLVREHGQLEEQVKEINESRSTLEETPGSWSLRTARPTRRSRTRRFFWRPPEKSGRPALRPCRPFRWRQPTCARNRTLSAKMQTVCPEK